jgi:hypothetical protein
MTAPTARAQPAANQWDAWTVLAFSALLLDALLLALAELFFLPLRLDGLLLPKVGDVPLPVSLLAALVTTPLLVRACGRIVPRVMLSGAPGVVWLLTVLVVGLGGAQGNLVLLGDWRGLLLLALGALPAAIAFGGVLGRRVPPGGDRHG